MTEAQASPACNATSFKFTHPAYAGGSDLTELFSHPQGTFSRLVVSNHENPRIFVVLRIKTIGEFVCEKHCFC